MNEVGERHLVRLHAAVDAFASDVDVLERWGSELARRLVAGQRLLAVGNGGSAAQAQHLTAELVGRYENDRRAFSAIALHTETSSVTAIANDYGFDDVFARQVRGHGRPGDVLFALSTSGRSPNVLAAVDAARVLGLDTWALTGPRPNPLAEAATETVACVAPATSTIQEVHLVAIHLLCTFFDRALEGG